MSYPQYLTGEEKLEQAKHALAIQHIVVICGSTTFMDLMAEANLEETAAGHLVLAPGCNLKEPHPLWADPVEKEELKKRLDSLHRGKIRLADEVLVVGPRIGDSTKAEIAYARELGKPVRFTDPLLGVQYTVDALHGRR
ncbi:hypothetical protein ABZ829_28195 [Streptomyces xanthochromogenes]|uniref:hypothetical protein n=1 Tax=Streptomyces xanthochromogenes TaxID=67384 RepID=UPI00342E2481